MSQCQRCGGMKGVHHSILPGCNCHYFGYNSQVLPSEIEALSPFGETSDHKHYTNTKNPVDFPKPAYTIDEMIDAMHNPTNKLRSIAELDKVVGEIIDRNPEWYVEFEKFVKDKLK